MRGIGLWKDRNKKQAENIAHFMKKMLKSKREAEIAGQTMQRDNPNQDEFQVYLIFK